MPATAHVQARHRVGSHRAALTIVVLCVALAASLGLLALRLGTGSAPAPASSVSSVDVPPSHLPPIDNGCERARPGGPC